MSFVEFATQASIKQGAIIEDLLPSSGQRRFSVFDALEERRVRAAMSLELMFANVVSSSSCEPIAPPLPPPGCSREVKEINVERANQFTEIFRGKYCLGPQTERTCAFCESV